MIPLLLMAVSSLALLAAAGREAWRPAPRPVRSEWCKTHIRLPSETGAQPGRFEIEPGHAYIREILDAIDDPNVAQITFLGATQVGKTELIRAIVLSQGEVDRAPMMFAGPDQIYIRESREVIYRTAELSPALRDRVPVPGLRNDRYIDLEKCLVWLAWSGSTQRLSGRACKIVLCSEVDRWQCHPSLAAERTKAFRAGATVIREGTPVGPSAYLDDYYRQSDRREYHVPCPICGEYQALRFFVHRRGPHAGRGGVGGLKDAQHNWRTPTDARNHAHYVCEHCGGAITDQQKPDMIPRGRWVRDGQRLQRDGKLTGKPKNPGRHRGYRLNSLYSSTVTFADAAERYLTIRDQPEGLERFFNDWLGLAFVPRGETPKWRVLGERLAGDYPRGLVSRHSYFLTAAADVQAHGVYWSVRAWGNLKTSWLVDFGYLPRKQAYADDADTGHRLAEDLAGLVPAVLQRRWPVDGENPRGLSALAVRVLGIDVGYRQTDVYRFVRSQPGDRVVAVAGDPKITPGSLYRLHTVDRHARTGKRYEGALQYWGIETNAFKTEIAERWQADRTQPGVWWLPADILTTPGGEGYLRQITAETRTLEHVHGRKVVRWELISKGLDNHWFDTEVYSACLADLVTGGQWDASAWEGPTGKAEGGGAIEQVVDRQVAGDFSAR